MKHIDIVIGKRSSILDIITELHIIFAVVNLDTSFKGTDTLAAYKAIRRANK